MSTSPSPVIPVAELGERVELPSGGYIQLRALEDLRAKHRKAIAATIPDYRMRPLDILTMQQKVAEVMILDWHLPYQPDAPLPSVQPDILDELSMRDENLLNKHLEPVLELVNPATVDPADHADPDSPTEPAGDSTPA